MAMKIEIISKATKAGTIRPTEEVMMSKIFLIRVEVMAILIEIEVSVREVETEAKVFQEVSKTTEDIMVIIEVNALEKISLMKAKMIVKIQQMIIRTHKILTRLWEEDTITRVNSMEEV